MDPRWWISVPARRSSSQHRPVLRCTPGRDGRCAPSARSVPLRAVGETGRTTALQTLREHRHLANWPAVRLVDMTVTPDTQPPVDALLAAALADLDRACELIAATADEIDSARAMIRQATARVTAPDSP